MTRFLSESLGAREPHFRTALSKLEAANGSPNHDIRLSIEVGQAAKAKVLELGLDPNDTTPEELYHVLQERVKADDARLTKKLRTIAATHVSAEGETVAGIVHTLRELPDSKRCFALKPAKLKAILRQIPPKKAMKQLGYRSFDSLLKHEAPASILAAAVFAEGSSWHSRLLDQYKKLKPSDFEDRNIAITHPDSAKWKKLASESVGLNKHNLVSLRELGVLVLLPLPKAAPIGSTLASLSLALHELNSIRAGSTYLKLCQVRRDFGRLVQTVANDEPMMSSRLLDALVPWQLIQNYSARFKQFGDSLGDLHIQLEDLAWHPIEETLENIDKDLAFWKGGAHLAQRQGSKPVSFNVVDAALNCCNGLTFDNRLTQHFQQSLWQELLMRYLKPESVEQTIFKELQPQLVAEEVSA